MPATSVGIPRSGTRISGSSQALSETSCSVRFGVLASDPGKTEDQIRERHEIKLEKDTEQKAGHKLTRYLAPEMIQICPIR